jgi:cobalt-zinc-cadmium efflux system membrane fusion protein
MTRILRPVRIWLVAALPLAACGTPANDVAPAPDQPTAAAPASGSPLRVSPEALAKGLVAVDTARAIDRAERLEAPAVLVLDESRTARLGSMVEGILVEAAAQVGDRVQAGAVLGSIHSPRVHEAWAAYRKAIAERRQREAEVRYADENARRAERLLAARAYSAQDVERARVEHAAALEALDMTRTEVRRSEEELEHLGITSGDDPTGESGERIPVRTPIAGVVLERLVTSGTAVTPGTPLFVVSDLGQLWAEAEVDELRLSSLSVGRPADVSVAAYPGETFPGRIVFIGDAVNPATRRVVVRCLVPNPDGRLKPQMYATVALGTGEPRRIVVAPAAAVQNVNGGPMVFVESEAGAFTPRAVRTGAEQDGLVEITDGLTAGERVATTGSFLLKSQLLGSGGAEQ